MTEQQIRHAADSAPASSSLPRAMLRSARPKQWAKNVLVFVAPAAAGVLTQGYELKLTVAAFISFCFVSSATYYVNDILDVESDRKHPKKSKRPIASGLIPIPLALVTAGVLFVAGVGVAALNTWVLAGVVGGYALLTTAYSLWMKAIPVVDLVILSAGFILRLLGGAYAAHVPVSNWFLTISLFGSLFIAAAKRYAEKEELGDRAAELRPTLGEYSTEYLGLVRTVAATGVLMSYCLWAVERADEIGGTPWLQLSIIPFLILILRYALLVDKGEGSAPEDVILHDRQMQVMGVILMICVGLGVYA